jgi:hypothetical protein
MNARLNERISSPLRYFVDNALIDIDFILVK